jgi:hypothetical protein
MEFPAVPSTSYQVPVPCTPAWRDFAPPRGVRMTARNSGLRASRSARLPEASRLAAVEGSRRRHLPTLRSHFARALRCDQPASAFRAGHCDEHRGGLWQELASRNDSLFRHRGRLRSRDGASPRGGARCRGDRHEDVRGASRARCFDSANAASADRQISAMTIRGASMESVQGTGTWYEVLGAHFNTGMIDARLRAG